MPLMMSLVNISKSIDLGLLLIQNAGWI